MAFSLLHFYDYYVGTFNDDAYYLLAAESLSNFKYDELALPEEPPLTSYYPGYPFLLALWLKLMGWDFFSAQVFSVFLAALGIALALIVAGQFLPKKERAILGFFLAANPLAGHFSSLAMSEPAYLVFSSIALGLAIKLTDPDKKSMPLVYGLGILTGFCFLIRPAGITLFASILLLILEKQEWARAGRLSLAFGFTVMPWLFRNALLGLEKGGLSLLGALHFGREWSDWNSASGNTLINACLALESNLVYYAKAFMMNIIFPAGLKINWEETAWGPIPGTIAIVLSLCFFAAIVRMARNNLLALYALTYFLFHFIWVNQAARYLYPIAPTLLTLAMMMITNLKPKKWPQYVMLGPAIILYFSAAAISHGHCWSQFKNFGGYGPPFPGQTFQWLKNNLGKNDVIASPMHGRLYLHTRIKSCSLPSTGDSDLYLFHLGQRQATHLVFFPKELSITRSGKARGRQDHLESMWRKHLWQKDRYRLVFKNEQESTLAYKILKDRKNFEQAYLYLRAGQKAYQDGDLPAASKRLRLALKKEPGLMSAAYAISLTLEKLNRIKEAADSMEKALNEFPLYTPGHYRLGEIYERARQWSKARKRYEIALTLAKRDNDAQTMKLCRESLERVSKMND